MAKKGKSGGKGKALKSAYGMYESEEERRKAIELAQKEAKVCSIKYFETVS